MSKVFPVITGNVNISFAENFLFKNLKDLIDNFLIKAQPDFYDGTRTVEINERIRKNFNLYIVSLTNTAVLYLPNFFTEKKGPTGSAIVVKRQACYDGTLNARKIYKLRLFINPETLYDNNTYAITAIYYGATGNFTVYTTYFTQSTDFSNPVGYRITQLNSWKMTGNSETFR